ncbi:hypothetical protein ZWY2020_011630 [Hordeum vulgare]|nr:hypothetical protein ZWY2020_011630 [Hordeum vulgare]
MQRQSGQQLGLGNPPVAKATATAPALAGKSHANAHAGKPLTAAVGQAKENTQDNRTQHRGRWGDDGFPGLGDGQNHGGSSSRGGRGYAWHNNGAAGNGFHAPPGQFVPGPSGPSNPKRGGYRQHWIGRGGGRKPRPPVLSPEQPADLNDSTVMPMTETVQEGADPSLPDQSLVSAKGDGVDRPSKWAQGPNDTGPNGYPKQTNTSQQKQSNLGAGNGPSNSAMHQDLRFGAFEPTSAPAKIGSRAASIQPSLPRILGKTPRSNKGSEQSKSVLKPLSLEEYLVGAKAESNTLDAVHGAPAPSTGVINVSTDIACMEGGIAAGLSCQPQAATPSEYMQVHEGAALTLHAHANNPARTEDAATTVMLCSDSCTPRA